MLKVTTRLRHLNKLNPLNGMWYNQFTFLVLDKELKNTFQETDMITWEDNSALYDSSPLCWRLQTEVAYANLI